MAKRDYGCARMFGFNQRRCPRMLACTSGELALITAVNHGDY